MLVSSLWANAVSSKTGVALSGSRAGASTTEATAGGVSEPPTGTTVVVNISSWATSSYGTGTTRNLDGGGVGDCIPRASSGE